MSNAELLEKAISTVKEAVKHDQDKDYVKAYQLYKGSLEYFMLALKYENNAQFKVQIRTKILEYIERAEYLKKNLNSSGNLKSTPDGDSSAKGNAGLQHLEDAVRSTIIDKSRLKVTWDDVSGLQGAKDALKEAIFFPERFPGLFNEKRISWKSILLYGPPGTGKSLLAKAVASESQSTFFSVSSSDIVSKWMGESERFIKVLFKIANENSPSVIFMDEIDSLCGERSDSEAEATRRIKTELLVQIQGISALSTGVLIIGATNTPWSLDRAIIRRFEKRIYIPLPDYHARLRLFEIGIEGINHSLTKEDLKYLAENTESFSGSDIAIIVREALMIPIRKIESATFFKLIQVPSKTNKNENISMWEPYPPGYPGAVEMKWSDIKQNNIKDPSVTFNDFVKACSNIRPSVNADYIQKYKTWASESGCE